MNIQPLRPLLFALLFLLRFGANAQCSYTLEMLDTWGDGWNGGSLTINIGGDSVAYTLDNLNDDGIDSTLTFSMLNGVPLTISFTVGGFPAEVSYNIYDNTGVLFLAGTGFTTGILFNGIGECVTCSKPSNFALENVWDNRAKLRWQPNTISPNPVESWRVVYGPQGFSPSAGEGDTLDVAMPKIQILGLQKKTWYDAYVQQYCGAAGGHSSLVGPLSFQTYWTNDVGVAGVAAPQSGCDLGHDSLKVVLANFGAAPQSLFTFRYAVNGEPAAVVPPFDGFYTGILGKDSSTVIAFKTLTDFSASGEYRIDIFTELATDEDLQNDTFTYYLTNRLQPTYVQQFEIWDGGWKPSGQNSSWEFGTPNKPSIPAAASGLNAWVTSLTGSHNFSELSYLESPCFDFSELDEDPALEFSLIHDVQGFYNGAWLEMSLDGGQSWEKVGEIGEGLNWYTEENEFSDLGEVWSGNSPGWVKARHSLPNSAGESDVRLRFVMASAPFFQRGGIGIDDVRIFAPFTKDLQGQSISTLGDGEECGLAADQIAFTFLNLGSQTQSGIKVACSINGAAPVLNNVAGSLATDLSITHTFSLPFDSRDGTFEIKCWTILNGDQAVSNDTATYTVDHLPNPVPFQEDFEAYDFPPTDWVYEPPFGFSVTNTHNNVSKVLAFNLYLGSTDFIAEMPRYGIIQPGDSLRFTYRITDFSSQGQTPIVLQGGSKIEIQISTDCGDTYQTLYTISAFNHTPTVTMRARKLSLDAYAGKAVKIRFVGTWGAGDFWFDLDNINVLSCPAHMGLTAELTPATPDLPDGTARVNVGIGNPPYTYEWSNASTEQTADSLAAGTYTVTVSDAFGCTDALTVTLGSSSADDLNGFARIALYPNPTSGFATIEARFSHSAKVQVEILNLLGQRVWASSATDSDSISESFDLGSFPAGLYLVRLSADGRTLTRKLVSER
ncbi:MAG: T9SS type A sorting domain-containing protein [Saprospiraceae bacterium]